MIVTRNVFYTNLIIESSSAATVTLPLVLLLRARCPGFLQLCQLLKITEIGDVVRSNTELIDMSDAQKQREVYPLYIIHDNENIKSIESLAVLPPDSLLNTALSIASMPNASPQKLKSSTSLSLTVRAHSWIWKVGYRGKGRVVGHIFKPLRSR